MACWSSGSKDDFPKILCMAYSLWVIVNISEKLAYVFYPHYLQDVSNIEDFCGMQFHYICSWPTGSEWHCYIWWIEGSLITSLPMTNSEWVTLYIFEKGSLITSFLWLAASEWHCTFLERQSHHFFSCDQQGVSDNAHFVKVILIASFHMANRKQWVTLNII